VDSINNPSHAENRSQAESSVIPEAWVLGDSRPAPGELGLSSSLGWSEI